MTFFGVPAAVMFALVALLGYIVGRKSSKGIAPLETVSDELRRARQIIRELEAIAQNVRRALANHSQSVVDFKSRVRQSLKGDVVVNRDALGAEADRLLAPTQSFVQALAQAYDSLRKQSEQLELFATIYTNSAGHSTSSQDLERTLEAFFDMRKRLGATFSLCLIVIDRLEQINKENGSDAGDRLIYKLRSMIVNSARDTDVVYALGEGEFAVVLPGADDQGAEIFAERVRDRAETQLSCTVSIGIAAAQEAEGPSSLLKRADECLYAAKAAGRNCIYRSKDGNVVRARSPEARSASAQSPTTNVSA